MSTALLQAKQDLGRPVRSTWGRLGLLGVVPAMALVAIYMARYDLGFIMSAYGLASVGRIIMQSLAAWQVRSEKFVNPFENMEVKPYVSIQMTAYNENLALFRRGLQSLKDQNWPKDRYEIVVLDDGSDNGDEIRKLCWEFKVRYIRAKHGGKREVMMVGFGEHRPEAEYILTGDSDTVWDPDATTRLVAKMVSDPSIGAATGHVATINEKDSWLTRLISVRYWYAFEIERASQSVYGGVTCVSGPLGIYRTELIHKIKDNFIKQRFLGKACTFGDDRHLTNLILGLGYKVVYTHGAVAYTDAPSKFKKYRKQQARWGRSFWREQLWTAKAIPKQHFMLGLDWALNLILPFLFAASIVWYVYQAITEGWHPVIRFFVMLVSVAALRAVPGIAATRQLKFLLMPVFALFHIFVLLPLKFWSLGTMTSGEWGNRSANVIPELLVEEPVLVNA